ncbi:hypothetical protein BJY00DRAFT_165289 [Aspergillus carlsbadensis]|nr:hypothetical protein BJY00DRAFT_165289 [Aspergillus carlsbadensis]
MSFSSDEQLPHSSAPPSAQPYRSLFGGSSQDVGDQQRQSRIRSDEFLGYTDIGATAGGGLETADEGFEDDQAYLSDIEALDYPHDDGLSLQGRAETYEKPNTLGPEHPKSSQSPPPYRPNRFHGSVYMWLKLTQDDRETAQALEETRAGDLAAHLYNAFTLQSQAVAKPQNVGGPGIDTPGYKYPLGSLEQWTAWPMSSDEVPRPDERLRRLRQRYITDGRTYKLGSDPRPSAALEECIIASLLRVAKDRFRDRDWEMSTSARSASVRHLELDDTKAKIEGGQKMRGQSTDTQQRDPEFDTDDRMSGTEWETDQESSRPPQRPTPQIDEDESRKKLRPLARKIIAQFDQLLMGLHRFHGSLDSEDRSRSRGRKRGRSSSWASDKSSVHSGHAPPEYASGIESNSVSLGIPSRSASARKKESTSNLDRSQSRGRKPSRKASRPQPRRNRTGGPQASEHRSISRYNNIQSGLTDWRDVLGVASMVGLPPAALRRATDRFSALSNEHMVDPPLPEGSETHFMEDVLVWASAQNKIAAGEGEEDRRPNLESQSPSPGTYTEERSTSPDNDRPKKAKSFKASTADSEKVLFCPFSKCPRHEKGFSRIWNLNQHLKNMHPKYQPESGRSRKRRAMQSGYDPGESE